MKNHLYDGHRNVWPLRQRKTTRTPTKRIKTLEGRLARCRVWVDPDEPNEWQSFINLNHESLYVKPATGEDKERFDYIVVLRPE